MYKLVAANKLALALTALLAAGLVGGALYVKSSPQSTSGFLPKAEENAETPATVSETPLAPPAQPPVAPSPESVNMVVDSPKSGSRITGGTVVSGRARVFEGRLAYRVKSTKKGQLVLGSDSVTGDSSLLSPYTFEVGFEKEPDLGDSGVLEVFSYSPKDGSEINKVVIQVTF